MMALVSIAGIILVKTKTNLNVNVIINKEKIDEYSIVINKNFDKYESEEDVHLYKIERHNKILNLN